MNLIKKTFLAEELVAKYIDADFTELWYKAVSQKKTVVTQYMMRETRAKQVYLLLCNKFLRQNFKNK